MGDIIKRKLIINTGIAISLFLLMAVYCIFTTIKLNSDKINERQFRMALNTLVFSLEENPYDNYKNIANSEIPFAVIGVDGQIIFQQGTTYIAGSKVDLHGVGSANSNSYRVPLIKDGDQFATLVAECDSLKYGAPYTSAIVSLIPLMLCLLGVGVCIIRHISIMKHDIFSPVNQIHNATKSILEGNLDLSVNYDYDGQIGTLCHDFEIMRSELSDSFKREKKLREDEKILLASISHDLKTPLASITGHVEGLLLDVVTEEDDIKRYAQIIMNKATMLNTMIDDIMEHTKSELYQLSIDPEEVYSAIYFKELIKDLSQDASQRRIAVICSDIPNVIIKLDKKRISEVMQNLFANSIKYGKINGKIEVIFSLEQADSNKFIVSVKDNGTGIAAADLPFIFNKFFRGDKSRTQSIPGSGLGLCISKYIVEQHGGKIECDSILNVGTEMTFFLPY